MNTVIIPYQHLSSTCQVSNPYKDRIAKQKRKTLAASLMLSKKYDYVITNSISDKGKSAFHKLNWDGDAGLGLIKTMIESSEDPRNSIVVLEDYERLSRAEPNKVLSQINTLLEAGLQIYIAQTESLFNQ